MSGKTVIYLVRHGQTEWNVQHKFQGHQDSPLTELGVKQAQWLGESIQNEPLNKIYSSPSLRALKTSELIKGTREIDIMENQDLREINLGNWEGRTQAEIKEKYSESFNNFWNDPEKFYMLGSETFQDVNKRAMDVLHQIMNENQGESILIVTHTVVVKLIMAYFENRPMKDIWNPPFIHPASLCKVEMERNNPVILLHGDTKHYKT